jgi:hypothetical protein
MSLLTAGIPWWARWLALVAVAAAFGGWCYVHGMQHTQAAWDAATVAQQADAMKAEKASRAKESQLKQQVIEAQNAAQERNKENQVAIAAARAQSDSLRDQLAATRTKLSTASADAVRQYAATVSDILSDCAAKYQSMAEAADGHAGDVMLLQEAWPK